MKALLLISLVFIAATCAFAQTKVTDELTLAPGVAKHDGLDEVYRKFSKAYRSLDHKVFSEIYTENAAYLVPGDNIQIGGTGIVKSFDDFFTAIRSRGQNVTISFEIIQRKVEGSMAYDVGIYTLNTYKDKASLGSGRGKFVVVALRDGARWRFQVDGYNDLPKPNPAQQ
jgi:ketosteroid isomerase-like protein